MDNIKRGELHKDAAILARHAKDGIDPDNAQGRRGGRLYGFQDLGDHHAQAVRDKLNEDPDTSGQFKVVKLKTSPAEGWRAIVPKRKSTT